MIDLLYVTQSNVFFGWFVLSGMQKPFLSQVLIKFEIRLLLISNFEHCLKAIEVVGATVKSPTKRL